MTGRTSAKVFLATLSVVTLAVLCFTIWKMLGAVTEAPPAPVETGAIKPAAVEQAAKAPPVQAVRPSRTFPARVGNIIDVSNNPDFAGLAGTKVSIDLKDVPLAEALAAFGQATSLGGLDDYTRSAPSREVPPISMKLKDAPLLEAVLQFCSRAGASISDFGSGQLKLQSAPLDGWVGRWSVAGPFALSLVRLESTTQLDPRAVTPSSAQLTANFMTEPGVGIASFSRTPTVDEALDENGRSIGTLGSTSLTRVATPAPLFTFIAKWNLSPEHGRKIVRLRGAIQVSVAGKMDKIQHDLGGTESFTDVVHGVKLELSPMTSTAPTRYNIKLHLTRGDADALYWQQLLAFLDDDSPRMMLDDKATRPARAGNSNPNPNERILTYLMTTQQGASAPQAFVLEIPSEQRQVRVPFEFTDVPLP